MLLIMALYSLRALVHTHYECITHLLSFTCVYCMLTVIEYPDLRQADIRHQLDAAADVARARIKAICDR